MTATGHVFTGRSTNPPLESMIEHRLPTTFADELLCYRRFLEDLARRYSSDSHDAQDLLQETFATALHRPPRSRRNVRSWLATVLRNLAISRYRKEKRQHRSDEEPPEQEVHDDPTHLLHQRSIQVRLREAVEKLDERSQAILHLSYFQDLPPREIAARLRVPVGTVRSRRRRALASLRAELARGRSRTTNRTRALAILGWLRPRGREPRQWMPAYSVAAILALVATPLLLWRLVGSGAGNEEKTSHAAAPESIGLLQRSADQESDVARSPVPGASRVVDSDPPSPRLALELLWRESGEPAGSIGVLLEYGGSPHRGDRREVVSGHDGEIRATELEPGPWKITPALGRARWIDVASDGSTAARIELPRGIEVSGVVRRRFEKPVPGAGIWVSWPERRDRGRIVAHADAEGQYHVAHLDPRSWIGASDGRRTAAEILSFGSVPSPDQPRELDLQVIWRRGVVRGHVVDGSGDPVPGALVSTLDLSEMRVHQNDAGLWVIPRCPPTTRIDERGGFVAYDTWYGGREHYVQVTASGFPTKRVPTGDANKTGQEVRVVLTPGGEVFGRLQSLRGDDVAGRWLELQDTVGSRYVRTEDDGSYAASGLHPGEVSVIVGASLPGGLDDTPHAPGGCIVTRELMKGECLEIDPLIGGSTGLRGTLRNRLGEPLAGWTVMLRKEIDFSTRRALFRGRERRGERTTTDASGRFSFASADPALTTIHATPSGSDAAMPRAWQLGVVAGADAELVVSAWDEPPATLTGRVLAEGRGELAANQVKVLLHSYTADWETLLELDAETRAFEVSALCSGDYEVGVFLVGERYVHLSDFSLRRGERLDLGELRLPPDGTLLVRPVLPARRDPKRVRLRISDPYVSQQGIGRAHVEQRLNEDGSYTCELSPGTYRVLVTLDELTSGLRLVEVLTEKQTVLELPLRSRKE